MARIEGSTAGAVHSALRVLLGVSGAESISLWRSGPSGPDLAAAVGSAEPALPELRAATIAVFAGEPPGEDALTLVTIEVPDEAHALLVARDPAREAAAHTSLLRAARPSLTALLSRRGVGMQDDAAAGQRRLQRLRYDLHDGPLQDVHLLAQDLRLFRDQLSPMIATHPDRDRALGRLEDLEAQLIALDCDLRRLLTSVDSPLRSAGADPEGPRDPVSLAQALVAVAEAFTARSGIVPRIEISGDIETLTDSQQIALLSLVRESLTNIRQHSGAATVAITVTAGDDHLTAEVRDDGDGFAVEEASTRAAQSGHLGLVGMRERMRMLGGDTSITSAPGGPTVVTATLPRWPVDPAAA